MAVRVLDGFDVDGDQIKFNAADIVANVGVANGVASLDSTGKVPLSQLPANSGGGGSSGGSGFRVSGLEGKRVVFFGDSISYGEGNNGHSFIDIISEMGICASVTKEAHTSSCVGPYNVYHDADGLDLIAMIQQQSSAIANADIVFCGYCGNDSDALAHNLIELGQPDDPASTNTICGHTRRAIQNIRNINPLVHIVWLFSMMGNFEYVHPSDSYVQVDYLVPTVKAMAEVCADCSVTYGTQYDGLYLNKTSGHILNDTAGHPTELGHTFIAEKIVYGYPFDVRPYCPVKHITLNMDGSYDCTFDKVLLYVSHEIDVDINYNGIIMRPKYYSDSSVVFSSEKLSSTSICVEYILVITSASTNMYTVQKNITNQPWTGGTFIFDGSVTIQTDAGGINYCTVNTTETIGPDETWTIVWNGTEYVLQSKYSNIINAYCFGNDAIENGEDDGSSVPFYGYKYQNGIMAFGTTTPTGRITLRIMKGEASVVSEYLTIFDGNTTVTSANPNYFVISNINTPFGANETYRVTFGSNHTEYTCQTFADAQGVTYDGYGIGNTGIVGGPDSGEPFLIYRDNASRIVGVTTQAAGSLPIKIEKYIGS